MDERRGMMAKQGKSKYTEDGVNIDLGDVFSKYAAEVARETAEVSDFIEIKDHSQGRFRGPRGFVLKNLPSDCELTGAVDGVGTKVVLIDAANLPETAASNLIAMTAMDITRYGGLPLVFFNLLDVSTLGDNVDSKTFSRCKRLMRGLGDLCLEHAYVIMNGETAELGVCVGSENPDAALKFNWGGFMLGVYRQSRLIYGDTLRPGQIIMALADIFRSNGISSVRKALKLKYGDRWWNNFEALSDIRLAAAPSAQYDRFLNNLHGWFNPPDYEPLIKMHLIVHLSGGAFKSKLRDDFLKPQNLSADFDNLFEPPYIMRKCAEWRGMNTEECFKTWNGGQGALVVIDQENEKIFKAHALYFGIMSQKCGQITEKRDYTIKIKSKFDDGRYVIY